MTDTRSRLAADALAGLWATPPSLPARWFYDERGSRLFEEITRLPEYYPTRRETEILIAHADEIAARTAATTLVELGSGTSTKTRVLLTALTAAGRPVTFVPLDVSTEVLSESAAQIAREYPNLRVVPAVADFVEPLPALPPGCRLVAFLGGTVGNFDSASRAALLARLRGAVAVGDFLLLGADLVKNPARLVAAYDDAGGVTADFNRNLIAVLGRELGGTGLDPADFAHVARWNPDEQRIEMWLRAKRAIHVSFDVLKRSWELPAGAEMLTEISVKFEPAALRAELDAAGFEPLNSWTDGAGDFSLTLARAR